MRDLVFQGSYPHKTCRKMSYLAPTQGRIVDHVDENGTNFLFLFADRLRMRQFIFQLRPYAFPRLPMHGGDVSRLKRSVLVQMPL